MNFSTLGLSDSLIRTLSAQGITAPTPIQEKAIPLALEGRDVMGFAQTGTGKTAAFGLPLITALLRDSRQPEPKSARALILAPTRELVNQISESLKAFADGTPLKMQRVVGGVALGPQIKCLSRGTDVVVATPGRLIDLLDRGALRLDKTRFLVLDEADQMLDIGFIHALRQIAPLLSRDRQTMLFSATMPKQMAELSRSYLTDPVRVEVSPPGKAADKIRQEVHYIAQSEKTGLLIELLDTHKGELALVFSRTKHGADRLTRKLGAAGHSAAAIHGNRSQGQRERALKAFANGELQVLVATDVAARGIDIPDVRYVYNFDLPNVTENFVHRIGRTARAGRDGCAIAFCAADEAGSLRDVEKLMGISIPVASGKPWPSHVEEAPKPRRRRGGGRPVGQGKPQDGTRGSGKPKPASKATSKAGEKPKSAKPQRRRRPRRAA
ncbi:DEAD/DEAH box helicase [Tropicimonas sp. S265A]|uniref:DEAD/DEAH box helicase n=1 Tax=Tropicimonas sp. S265A TaxID=3415134 RepID=UPI003C7ADEE9